MPLMKGSTDQIISENIATLVREGKPQQQAIAIAYSQAGRSTRKPDDDTADADAEPDADSDDAGASNYGGE
jgi:hypothetical protein